MSTMTNNTMAVHLSVEEKTSSKPARIAAVEHLIGKDVRVKTGYSSDVHVGSVGVLRTIDRNDSSLTFMVELVDAPAAWVYDVEPVDATADGAAEAPEEKTPEQQQIERLEERVGSLESALYNTRSEYETFKENVREVAIRVAEEQGWCDNGLNDVLDELGLEPKTPPRKRVTMVIEVTLEGEPSRADADEDWTRRSVNGVEVSMDGDWNEVEVTDYSVDVRDVEDAD